MPAFKRPAPAARPPAGASWLLRWAQRYAAWCQLKEQQADRPGLQAQALRRSFF